MNLFFRDVNDCIALMKRSSPNRASYPARSYRILKKDMWYLYCCDIENLENKKLYKISKFSLGFQNLNPGWALVLAIGGNYSFGTGDENYKKVYNFFDADSYDILKERKLKLENSTEFITG